MPNPDHVLNLTFDSDGVVHLHADKAGIDYFISKLQGLRANLEKGQCEHAHFMTDDWGGQGLSDNRGISEAEHARVHHLKVFAWTDHRAEELGFKRNLNKSIEPTIHSSGVSGEARHD